MRYKSCWNCGWSSPITVIADGANHWDASLLVLNSGDILALESLQDIGQTEGKIRSIRSTNGGCTWGIPCIIFDEPGPELYPVALQKSDGYIHLMFRDGNHSSNLQIGQIWSADNGYTWMGHSVFANSAQAKQFSFIATQGGQNITVIASIFNGANWYVNHWTSWDNGSTWSGPYQVTTTAGAGDSEFSMGCRGPIFTYSANPYLFAARRYDWYPSCQ
jgi:hypothetical protein